MFFNVIVMGLLVAHFNFTQNYFVKWATVTYNQEEALKDEQRAF